MITILHRCSTKRKGSGLGSVLDSIGKKQKMSTLVSTVCQRLHAATRTCVCTLISVNLHARTFNRDFTNCMGNIWVPEVTSLQCRYVGCLILADGRSDMHAVELSAFSGNDCGGLFVKFPLIPSRFKRVKNHSNHNFPLLDLVLRT